MIVGEWLSEKQGLEGLCDDKFVKYDFSIPKHIISMTLSSLVPFQRG